MFTPSFTPMGEHSLLFRRMEGRIENFTTLGDKFNPRGQNSTLGDNFAPGGQSLPLRAKLRMGLSFDRFFLVPHAKTKRNMPDDHKLYQMTVNSTKRM
jgi:hypothetical protein